MITPEDIKRALREVADKHGAPETCAKCGKTDLRASPGEFDQWFCADCGQQMASARPARKPSPLPSRIVANKTQITIFKAGDGFCARLEVPWLFRSLPGIYGGQTEEGPWIQGNGESPEAALADAFAGLGRAVMYVGRGTREDI